MDVENYLTESVRAWIREATLANGRARGADLVEAFISDTLRAGLYAIDAPRNADMLLDELRSRKWICEIGSYRHHWREYTWTAGEKAEEGRALLGQQQFEFRGGLSKDDVTEIELCVERGLVAADLAAEFQVGVSEVCRIAARLKRRQVAKSLEERLYAEGAPVVRVQHRPFVTCVIGYGDGIETASRVFVIDEDATVRGPL